jgi:hypothetical protein
VQPLRGGRLQSLQSLRGGIGSHGGVGLRRAAPAEGGEQPLRGQ